MEIISVMIDKTTANTDILDDVLEYLDSSEICPLFMNLSKSGDTRMLLFIAFF